MTRYFSNKLRHLAIIAATLIISVSSLDIYAETVSQKMASQLAQQFFNAANGQVMAAPKMVYNGRRLTTNSLFVPFYVYNFPSGGFVIISAENKAFPILAYNLSENFNPDKIGDKTKALLTEYARDIERIRYDSRIPYDAINAWNNFPNYVAEILDAPYEATDVLIPAEEAYSTIDNIIEEDNPELASITYSPAQWQDAINAQLATKSNALIGIFDKNNFLPATVHGRKGDFYRIDLDSPNRSLFRLMSTEYLSDGQIADLTNPRKIEETPEPDDAFRLFDDFVAETRAIEQEKQREIENFGVITDPVTVALGGGHYVARLPEDITRLNLYNIGGALVGQLTFKSTDTANIDISAQPAGFYVALIQGKSGKIYGIKLAR